MCSLSKVNGPMQFRPSLSSSLEIFALKSPPVKVGPLFLYLLYVFFSLVYHSLFFFVVFRCFHICVDEGGG